MALQTRTLPAITIIIGGQAEEISATPLAVASVLIQADYTNVGNIVVGDSNVTPSSGIEIAPGGSYTLGDDVRPGQSDEIYLNELYINSATSGNKARVQYFKKVQF